MKSCFVSMPVGRQRRASSNEVIDFEAVYAQLVGPALLAADLTPLRWQTARGGSGPLTQRDALGAIIASDVLLADVSSLDPNVMYELGVRHAANRGPTVLIAVEGEALPFYASYIPAHFYDPARPAEALDRLANALRFAARRSDGSPVYEFFPELRVQLPAELLSEARRARRANSAGAGADVAALSALAREAARGTMRGLPRRSVEAAEAAIRGAVQSEPDAFVAMLKAYRDAGDWERLIQAGRTAPPEVERDPQLRQLVAVALGQRGQPGDEADALQMMQGLLDETGGNAEVLGIMGRVYKNRYKREHDPEDLHRAIAHYRDAFALQPNDFYAGYNAATLTSLLPDEEAHPGLAELLPRVKRCLQDRLDAGEMTYSLATAQVELAVIERDWAAARRLADSARTLDPTDWQRAASIESLARLGTTLSPLDQIALSHVIATLESGEPDRSRRAEVAEEDREDEKEANA